MGSDRLFLPEAIVSIFHMYWYTDLSHKLVDAKCIIFFQGTKGVSKEEVEPIAYAPAIS